MCKIRKDHLILVTGGIYVSSGELVKVCPYSSTVEMVLMGMKVAYKSFVLVLLLKRKMIGLSIFTKMISQQHHVYE